MFVNIQQMPHAKYGRDQCIGCMRRLGLGGGKIATLLAVDKSTIHGVLKRNDCSERFEGFDVFWLNQRMYRKRKALPSMREVIAAWNHSSIEEIQDDIKYWEDYDKKYWNRYKEYTKKRVEHHKRKRAAVRNDPVRYAHKLDMERTRVYLAKGVPLDQIPPRGTQTQNAVPPSPHSTKLLRRKREYLRDQIREVWYGKVSDLVARRRVGCSVLEFQCYIRGQFKEGWSDLNYGKVWSFDHIVPCAAFDIFNSDDIAALNHHSNLRPCCVVENSLKGSRSNWEI